MPPKRSASTKRASSKSAEPKKNSKKPASKSPAKTTPKTAKKPAPKSEPKPKAEIIYKKSTTIAIARQSGEDSFTLALLLQDVTEDTSKLKAKILNFESK